MSLVDYASSSDEDVPDNMEEEDENHHHQQELHEEQEPKPQIEAQAAKPQNSQSSGASLPKQQVAGPSPLPSISNLPDASMLLNSPTVGLSGSDHASRVSAAMAENASRKRELNVGSSRSEKVARGNLVATRNVPDTGGGLLVPPQLKGRSNVVTEDIGKLFVRRHAEPSSH
ncbi:hypothetical protein NC652_009809 [Populus alba x Populus x berolinensis]|uniref:Uncharacterized protein n=3 Tax=Populus TaxID=3689 RepID=A0ACC4CNW8_POPAL|nr:uncharacterized protein LOC118054320 [Populus alba]KAJ6944550.1 hypothetical protein NC652_009809 [Populus alba x Populus x berolinensis]KAJ7005129.1 hypothetical protein NC653_009828 [Populus alba x Populus x berolinensis]TKS08927.1 hypothetical protein D5086_0000102260 [Populus alba]